MYPFRGGVSFVNPMRSMATRTQSETALRAARPLLLTVPYSPDRPTRDRPRFRKFGSFAADTATCCICQLRSCDCHDKVDACQRQPEKPRNPRRHLGRAWVFRPRAKHSKSFSSIDCISVCNAISSRYESRGLAGKRKLTLLKGHFSPATGPRNRRLVTRSA